MFSIIVIIIIMIMRITTIIIIIIIIMMMMMINVQRLLHGRGLHPLEQHPRAPAGGAVHVPRLALRAVARHHNQ